LQGGFTFRDHLADGDPKGLAAGMHASMSKPRLNAFAGAAIPAIFLKTRGGSDRQ